MCAMKYHLRFIVLSFVLIITFLLVNNANAVLYSPGQTLDPACVPTDIGCGIIPNASSGANG